MSEKRTGRFISYAIGEILLVVIGILIALQIDNWNDERLERKLEREYLASMLYDLEVDTREIEEKVAGNAKLLDGLGRLLVLLGTPGEDPKHDRQMFIHALVYTYWYLTPDFSELTMTQLKSSGNLLLIRDKEIRDAMLRYAQAIEKSRYQFEEMKNYFHVIEATQKELFNLVLARQAFEYIEENPLRMLDPLAKFEPLVPHGQYLLNNDSKLMARYYGDALMYRTALSNSSFYVNEQKKIATALSALIKGKHGIE